MKKIALSLLLALSCVTAFAQEKNINLGVAFGMFDRYMLGNADIVDLRSDGVSYKANPSVLPTITLEAGYIFPGNRIGAFLGAYWSYARNDLHGGPSPLREDESILHLVPQVRCYYLFTGEARLYATLGLGVRHRVFAETFEGDTIRARYTSPSFIFSPFGMSFGGRWTFSCDFGYGTPWSMCSFSAGYRF